MSAQIEREIQEMVERETRAWDTQDLDLLLSLFHPDMVWPWPRTPASHDPLDWVLELGRFDYGRWRAGWQKLFETHRLVHNRRTIRKIVVSREGDGALAVVDVDTLWREAAPARSTPRWAGSGNSSCTPACLTTRRSARKQTKVSAGRRW